MQVLVFSSITIMVLDNKGSNGGAMYLYVRNGITTIDCDFSSILILDSYHTRLSIGYGIYFLRTIVGNIAQYYGGGISLYKNNTLIMPKCRLLGKIIV